MPDGLRVPALAAEDILAQLEEDIVLGRLGPRVRLVEDDLIARFGAKRHLVRSVLDRLVARGLAVKVRNRGAMVRQFERGEIEDIYAMRALLHREAAGLIPLPGRAEYAAALDSLHRAHAAAVAAGDLSAVIAENEAFHDVLFAACGNALLAEAIRHYGQMSRPIRSYRIADPGLLAQARDEHAAMIAAIRDADRARLVDLCVRHIEPSKQAYLSAHSHLLAGPVGLATGGGPTVAPGSKD
jgi:DNA-binding GntR family transcriptional regulator